MTDYARPPGGLPPQTALMPERAVFTEAYAVIPAATMTDIVTSVLPGWERTRAWIIARPLSGFAETFAHYMMEVAPGGGSDAPEPEADAEGVLFVTGGTGRLTVAGADHPLAPGAYAYLAPGAAWRLRAEETLSFHWIRKAWEPPSAKTAPPSPVRPCRPGSPPARSARP